MNRRPDRHSTRHHSTHQHHPDRGVRFKTGDLAGRQCWGLARRSRVWLSGLVALLVCLVIGLNRGAATATTARLFSPLGESRNLEQVGVVSQFDPKVTTTSIAIEVTTDDHTSTESKQPSVTQLRLQGQNRQAVAIVLRSLGVPDELTRTLQRDDFPVLTLMALGLDQPDDSDQLDREVFRTRLISASEAGVRLSSDRRLALQELTDIFQAIGERDLVEPLLIYLLAASEGDDDRAAIYERLGRFHVAQAQWHENYVQADLTTEQYQAALADYETASQLVQGDRAATMRLRLAHLRAQLAERRYNRQHLEDELNVESEAAYSEFEATLTTLAQGFHRLYRDVIEADATPNTTPNLIAMQLDLASQLACLQTLATPNTETFAVSPTARHCAAPAWAQPLAIVEQIRDDRHALIDRALRASTDLRDRQYPESLAARIAQRLRLQAVLLNGDAIAEAGLTPAIAAEMIPPMNQELERAEHLEAQDLTVQLLWQAGRLAIAAQQPMMAREYYAQAIAALDQLRIDLGSLETDWRYDFRDAIAPLYQDYLALLLPLPDATVLADQAIPTDRDDLTQAITTLQRLQLAELDDFFGEACAIPQTFQVEQLDDSQWQGKYRHTSLLATVVLPDRTETIIAFPQISPDPEGTIARQWLRFSNASRQSEVEFDLTQWLEALQGEQISQKTLDRRTQGIYDRYFGAAIAAMEQATSAQAIDTILFLPDSGFRNVPLGALRSDGGSYLLERYEIAVIPSFDLIATDLDQRSRLRTLAVGRSKFEDGLAISNRAIASLGNAQGPQNSGGLIFTDLGNVVSEILGIVDLLPQSSYLLDEDFLSDRLAETIASRRYDVAHIATHGSFGALAAQTFIVAQDGPIPFDRLGQLLRSNDPTRATDLDLVIFSACQTAEGSDRAVLGMAGMGLRAGVRSTIGSLWNVDDLSTSLIMQMFYQYRRDGLGKAAALAAAQRDAISGKLDAIARQIRDYEQEGYETREAHQRATTESRGGAVSVTSATNTEVTSQRSFTSPYFWSPFVLVGDW
ncbi:MAG: CHAT domain-containing protein [Coleofasciculaceae cyanobacterium RL_1_1]|nr:CHAT domain-containing protein [Coleofasciculaceae cyanobacterium RL_1_1]